jgi:hypothetical protein
MTARSVVRRETKSSRRWLQKWFGSNRGTHWNVAGAVAVIILASYLVYNGRADTSVTAMNERARSLVAHGEH